MIPDPQKFLESCSLEGVSAFKLLIAKMVEVDCEKLVLIDHPDNGLLLGVEDDKGLMKTVESLPVISNFHERYEEYLGISADHEDYHFYWYQYFEDSWSWMQECWKSAGGPESAKTAILVENGTGDALNLATGEEVDSMDEQIQFIYS